LTNAVVARFVELSEVLTVTPFVVPNVAFEIVKGALHEMDEGVTDSEVLTFVIVNNPGVMEVSFTSFTRTDPTLKSEKVVI
jgi:hypothetical protein